MFFFHEQSKMMKYTDPAIFWAINTLLILNSVKSIWVYFKILMYYSIHIYYCPVNTNFDAPSISYNKNVYS